MTVFRSAEAGCETCEQIDLRPNCVTITYPQFFEGLLQVTVVRVFLNVTVECRNLGR